MTDMTAQVTIPASTSYVSVADLKTHLLLFGDTSYDTELQAILLSTEDFISDFLGEYIVSTTVRRNFFSFEDLLLENKSVSSVVVSYWDTDNTAQVFSSGQYVLDTSMIYPIIKFKSVPSGLSDKFENAGFVTYATSLAFVPSKVKHAVLVIAAELFENRAESSERKMEAVKLTAMRLIQSNRGW